MVQFEAGSTLAGVTLGCSQGEPAQLGQPTIQATAAERKGDLQQPFPIELQNVSLKNTDASGVRNMKVDEHASKSQLRLIGCFAKSQKAGKSKLADSVANPQQVYAPLKPGESLLQKALDEKLLRQKEEERKEEEKKEEERKQEEKQTAEKNAEKNFGVQKEHVQDSEGLRLPTTRGY